MTREPYHVVFTTERGGRHQRSALRQAPQSLAVTMLRRPSRQALTLSLAEADYWVSERVGTVDADLLSAAPCLRLIVRLGSLTHDIDLEAARTAGVSVCRWPVAGTILVAEHVVMQLLALSKQLMEVASIARAASERWGESRRTDEDMFAYHWSGRTNLGGLWRRTVGILGFGEIGAEVARRLNGWDVDLLYVKRRRLPEEVEDELGIRSVDEDTLVQESDFVVNLLPYFPETDRKLDAGFFARMKKGSMIVSCGSGSVIDEDALADALHSEHVAGAALDTFEWEPLRPNHPLVQLARRGFSVLLTPHTAAGSGEPLLQEPFGPFTPILSHIAGDQPAYPLA